MNTSSYKGLLVVDALQIDNYKIDAIQNNPDLPSESPVKIPTEYAVANYVKKKSFTGLVIDNGLGDGSVDLYGLGIEGDPLYAVSGGSSVATLYTSDGTISSNRTVTTTNTTLLFTGDYNTTYQWSANNPSNAQRGIMTLSSGGGSTGYQMVIEGVGGIYLGKFQMVPPQFGIDVTRGKWAINTSTDAQIYIGNPQGTDPNTSWAMLQAGRYSTSMSAQFNSSPSTIVRRFSVTGSAGGGIQLYHNFDLNTIDDNAVTQAINIVDNEFNVTWQKSRLSQFQKLFVVNSNTQLVSLPLLANSDPNKVLSTDATGAVVLVSAPVTAAALQDVTAVGNNTTYGIIIKGIDGISTGDGLMIYQQPGTKNIISSYLADSGGQVIPLDIMATTITLGGSVESNSIKIVGTNTLTLNNLANTDATKVLSTNSTGEVVLVSAPGASLQAVTTTGNITDTGLIVTGSSGISGTGNGLRMYWYGTPKSSFIESYDTDGSGLTVPLTIVSSNLSITSPSTSVKNLVVSSTSTLTLTDITQSAGQSFGLSIDTTGKVVKSAKEVAYLSPDTAQSGTINVTGLGNFGAGCNAPIFHASQPGSQFDTPNKTSPVIQFSSNSKIVGFYIGNGSPEGATSAVQGSLYLRQDGAETSLYTKASDNAGTASNTGWVSLTNANTRIISSNTAFSINPSDRTILFQGFSTGSGTSITMLDPTLYEGKIINFVENTASSWVVDQSIQRVDGPPLTAITGIMTIQAIGGSWWKIV